MDTKKEQSILDEFILKELDLAYATNANINLDCDPNGCYRISHCACDCDFCDNSGC